MITPAIQQSLKKLETQMRDGTLTPAKLVTEATLVCFTEREAVNGALIYRQQAFETLPLVHQQAFRNHKRGDTVSQFKIVGIFDIWLPELARSVLPIKQMEV
jgi:hypothetical protein